MNYDAALLLEITLKSTAVLMAAWITTLLMPRSSAAARHLVWTGAFFILLGLPLAVLFAPAWKIGPLPVRLAMYSQAIPTVVSDSALTDEVPSPPGPLSEVVSPQNRFTLAGSNIPALLLKLWLTGVVLFMLKLVMGLIAAARIARQATRIVDSDWMASRKGAAVALGLSRETPILKSDRTTVASTCGILKPRVLVPIDAERWDFDRRRMVLLHELAHVKRRDCLVQTLARFSWTLYWFNPLARFAATRMIVEQEQACDDMVLAAGIPAPDYAKELLAMARAFHPGALPQWATLSMARPSQLGERLAAILDRTRSRRPPARGLYATVAAIVCLLIVPFGAARLAASVVPVAAPPLEFAKVPLASLEIPAATQNPLGPANVNLVYIDATVTDASGRLVTGLGAKNFQISENGVDQSVESFSEQSPLTIGLITGNIPAALADGLSTLLKTGGAQDQYFLAQMEAGNIDLTEDFTTDISRLQNHISSAPTPPGLTWLESLYLSVLKMKSVSGRKVLLLITDGEDGSRETVTEVKNYARQENVQIFAIGIGMTAAGRASIEELVADTQGKAFFPDSVSEVADSLTKIGIELHNQYVLGYRPSTGTRDGDWRQIKIVVSPPPGMSGLVVRSTTGYSGPKALRAQVQLPNTTPMTTLPLAFAAASVKPWPPTPAGEPFIIATECHGIDSDFHHYPASVSPPGLGRCYSKKATLQFIIESVYINRPSGGRPPAVPLDQSIVGGPSWVGEDEWGIDAVVENPSMTTEFQLVQTMQQLLVDRFKLKFHWETKEVSGYTLGLAKDGSKLKESAEPGLGGFYLSKEQQGLLTSKMVTSSDIVRFLSFQFDTPVQDNTGLTGKYALELKWTPRENEFSTARNSAGERIPATVVLKGLGQKAADPSGPSIFAALEIQLGLKLEPRKVPIQVFVIDHVERPTPN